jgi:hypothetical protein
VLRRIFGPKRDEVTGEWKKLNNDDLNDLYSSPKIVWVKKDSIKMNLLEVDWVELVQHMDRWWLLVNAVMNFWVPCGGFAI